MAAGHDSSRVRRAIFTGAAGLAARGRRPWPHRPPRRRPHRATRRRSLHGVHRSTSGARHQPARVGAAGGRAREHDNAAARRWCRRRHRPRGDRFGENTPTRATISAARVRYRHAGRRMDVSGRPIATRHADGASTADAITETTPRASAATAAASRSTGHPLPRAFVVSKIAIARNHERDAAARAAPRRRAASAGRQAAAAHRGGRPQRRPRDENADSERHSTEGDQR